MPTLPVHRHHPRSFDDFRFVYPVISRRSGGLSLGLNVNPDKRCNFDCLYCQVDRTIPATIFQFDVAAAEEELQSLLQQIRDGSLARRPQFANTPPALLTLKDIALSGDGEPTTLHNFAETIAMVTRHQPAGVKLVLITDAGGLARPDVERGLALLDAHHGEIWAKLDAGTEAYFKFINRTATPFTQILQNITACARQRAVTIQTLFLKVHSQAPSAEEISAYCDRLTEILQAGGQIVQVQVNTLARQAMTIVDGLPAWKFVAPLSEFELDAITAVVRTRTGLPVTAYPGA